MQARRLAALAALTTFGLSITTAASAATPARSTNWATTGESGVATGVVVRSAPGSTVAVATTAARNGVAVGRQLSIIDGFAATATRAQIAALKADPRVVSVTDDASGRLESVDPAQGYDTASDLGGMQAYTKMIGARNWWKAGVTGAGVDVAIVDSGVSSQVQGLNAPGKVVNGPDLSLESQSPTTRYTDSFGHGTHLSSLIAGRDNPLSGPALAASSDFDGVAPDARIINMKVATRSGAADVSEVIAAIDWTVSHAHTDGLNIKVLCLAYGTDSTQPASVDPLAYAVDQAWKAGITVVVAAGNEGYNAASLTMPALSRTVLTVGASDPGTTTALADDTIAPFQSNARTGRHSDVVADGVHLVGLLSPDSTVDQHAPAASHLGGRFVRGSGTSQATAVVAGMAALVAQKFPLATPDAIKQYLVSGAVPVTGVDSSVQGAGQANLLNTLQPMPTVVAAGVTSSGTGSLETARGGKHLTDANGTPLTGEQDIFGKPWTATTAVTTVGGLGWLNGWFNGSQWAGNEVGTGSTYNADGSSTGWSGTQWSGTQWSGTQWSGTQWSGTQWSGTQWSGTQWSGTQWSGTQWSGTQWSGTQWSGTQWSGTQWSGTQWSGQNWSGTQWSAADWR